MKKSNLSIISMCIFAFCFIINMQVFATNYFVKTDGVGTGLSWDNAMSFNDLITKLGSDFQNGDVVYMAGGTYKPALESVTMNIINGISIIGGFDPLLSGTTVPEIGYPSLTPTIISGDLNNDGIPNAGDARLLTISSTNKVTIKGIIFTNGYTANSGSNRPGIQVLNGSRCDILYCTISNNKSDLIWHANVGGGAGLFVNDAIVYCYATTFKDNVAATRGAAIRSHHNNDRLILERCLLSGNINTGDWSGAIMFGAADSKVFCINTTITGNSVRTGGGGLNGAGWLYLISSTVANNTCSVNKTVGLDIRLESTNKVFAYNSIVTNSDGSNPSIFINGAAYNLTSNGNNVFGKIGGTGTLVSRSTDLLNMQYVDVFGSNVLSNNLGYPQSIALKEDITGSTLSKIQNYTDSVINSIHSVSDLTLDGRGAVRPAVEPVSVGAFQYPDVNSIKLNTWYFIKNPNCGNKYLTDNGIGNLITGTDFIANQDNLLWKFEDMGNGMLNIVGKVSDGNVKPAAFNSAMTLISGQSYLTMQLLGEGQYNILSANYPYAIYMDEDFNIMLTGGSGGLNTTAAWVLEEYNPAIMLSDSIICANNLLSTTLEGTLLGTYTSDARNALQTSIATSQAIYDNATAYSVDELKQAYLNLSSAIVTYKQNYFDNFSSTVENPKWVYIKSLLFSGVTLTSNNVVENGALHGQSQNTSTDAELWRFQYVADKTFKIVNKAQPNMGLYIGESNDFSNQGVLKSIANSTTFVLSASDNNSCTFRVVGTSDTYMLYNSDYGIFGYAPMSGFEKWIIENVPTFTGTGDWTETARWNTGSVPNAANTVYVNGTSTVSSHIEVSGLTLHSSGTITVTPGKQLTVTSSMENNGILSLQSNATNGTATILTPTLISGSGTANMQQWLSSGRNWYISSPFADSHINDISNASKLYYYDESTTAVDKWIQVSSGTLTPLKGYVAKVDGTTGNVTFTGNALNNGEITNTIANFALTATEGNAHKGFNLIGNPYPSYVNWMLANKTNLEPSIWYRTINGSGAYVFDTYNATPNVGTDNNGTAVTQYIAPMQAVWVRVVAGTIGTLGFDNTMRSHQDQSIVGNRLKVKAANVQSVLRLQISNGINNDQTIVLFNTNASDEYDAYDSPKMSNNNSAIPEIYTTVGNEKVVINGMNILKPDHELPLGFATGQANNFVLRALEISNFDFETKVVLKDKLLNKEHELTIGSEYNFRSEVTSGTSRFGLIFRSSGLTTGTVQTNIDKPLIYRNTNNKIAINCTETISEDAMASVYNALGQRIEIIPIRSHVTVIDKAIKPGMYVVTVCNGGENTTNKVILN